MQKLIVQADPLILNGYKEIPTALVLSLNRGYLPSLGLEAVMLEDFLPPQFKPAIRSIDFMTKVGPKELEGTAGVIYVTDVHTEDDFRGVPLNWFAFLRKQGYTGALVAYNVCNFDTPYLEAIRDSADLAIKGLPIDSDRVIAEFLSKTCKRD